MTEQLLDESRRVVADRDATYGSPLETHERTADFWSAFLGVPISAEQVVWMNVLQKVSREAGPQPVRDTRVDLVGFVMTLETMDTERERRDASIVEDLRGRCKREDGSDDD